jgi:predicted transcriptional regulator
MANSDRTSDEVTTLLRQLVAIEPWRSGLSQTQILARLGIGMTAVSQMRKGVEREITVRIKAGD